MRPAVGAERIELDPLWDGNMAKGCSRRNLKESAQASLFLEGVNETVGDGRFPWYRERKFGQLRWRTTWLKTRTAGCCHSWPTL